MLVTALKKEKQQIFQAGKIEGKLDDAQVMLSKGMEVSLISEITSLPESQIQQLKSELNSDT
jgi:hypothetical protein